MLNDVEWNEHLENLALVERRERHAQAIEKAIVQSDLDRLRYILIRAADSFEKIASKIKGLDNLSSETIEMISEANICRREVKITRLAPAWSMTPPSWFL